MSSRPVSVAGLVLDWLYTAYATLVFSFVTFLLVCPLILLLPGGTVLRRHLGAWGMRLNLLLMGVPFRVRGSENFPDGACIVVSNHGSYIDGMVMTSALPRRFTFLIQHGAANWPYAGAVLRKMQYRFVDRSSARAGAVQTRAMLRELAAGESFAIFAEGTFKPEPGLLPFKNGAFMLAAKSGLPIVPVTLRGTRRLLQGTSWRFRWSRITVDIGKPLPAGLPAATLRDIARATILAGCGEPDAAGAAVEDVAEAAEAA